MNLHRATFKGNTDVLYIIYIYFIPNNWFCFYLFTNYWKSKQYYHFWHLEIVTLKLVKMFSNLKKI